MSGSVDAKCTCGYAAEVRTDSGMAGPVPDYFPALCPRCAEVVPADATSWPTICSRCGDAVAFYDAPDLQQMHGSRTVIDGRTLTDSSIRHRLDDGAYRCPKSRAVELRFTRGGQRWD